MYKAKVDFYDFEELGDTYLETGLGLPNGATFDFWDCKIRYTNPDLTSHYLEIFSTESKAVVECLIILSFFTDIPLLAIAQISETTEECPPSKQLDKMKDWSNKLDKIQREIKNNSESLERDEIISWMKRYEIGLRNGFRQYYEDAYLQFFKLVENNSRIIHDQMGILGTPLQIKGEDSVNSYFENILRDIYGLDQKIDEISKKFTNSLQKVVNDNTTKIFLSINLLKKSLSKNVNNAASINPRLDKYSLEKIKRLVKYRNKIVHGVDIEISEKDVADIQYIAGEYIAIHAFRCNRKDLQLSNRKFGEKYK